MNQSMASTQQDSMNLSSSNITATATTPTQDPSASKVKDKKEDAAAIYEMQRNYYFGGPTADADDTAKTTVAAKPLKQFAEASDNVPDCPSGSQSGSFVSPGSENKSSFVESAEDEQEASKMPVMPVSSARESKQLDAIVELNYEASSDEEERLLETQAV